MPRQVTKPAKVWREWRLLRDGKLNEQAFRTKYAAGEFDYEMALGSKPVRVSVRVVKGRKSK